MVDHDKLERKRSQTIIKSLEDRGSKIQEKIKYNLIENMSGVYKLLLLVQKLPYKGGPHALEHGQVSESKFIAQVAALFATVETLDKVLFNRRWRCCVPRLQRAKLVHQAWRDVLADPCR